MSHIIIIIGKLEDIAGDATTGAAFDLLTACNAAHGVQEEADRELADAIEAKFEEIESALVEGEGLSSGVSETFEQFTVDLNDLIT